MPSTSQVTVLLLVLMIEAVSDWLAPACTLAVVGHTPTSTAAGVNEQPVSPALAGASLVSEFIVTATSALSSRPASSVTVRRTADTPHEGMTREAVAVPAFCSVRAAPPLFVQAY